MSLDHDRAVCEALHTWLWDLQNDGKRVVKVHEVIRKMGELHADYRLEASRIQAINTTMIAREDHPS